MKTLTNVLSKILIFISTLLGLIITGTDEVISIKGCIFILIMFLFSLIVCTYTVNKHAVLSRLVAIVCVVKAMIASAKSKLTPADLILIRRKNVSGGYLGLYDKSIGRYYARI